MYEAYHSAIMDYQFQRLADRAVNEQWTDAQVLPPVRSYVFIRFRKDAGEYLARIDAAGYPVRPYWVGFLDPALSPADWLRVSETDARYWPWSPMPGMHGSFNIFFMGACRVFWCRPCVMPFFLYHGHEVAWQPEEWPLDVLVANLRDAVNRAEHPNVWRPIQRSVLLDQASRRGVRLPEGAGLGDK